MKNLIASLLLLLCFNSFGFNQPDTTDLNSNHVVGLNTYQRELPKNLKEKYNDDDFIYKEKKEKPKKSSNINSAFLDGFIIFMKFIFPFLLGIFIVYIILKTVLNIDIRFWKKQNNATNTVQKLEFDNDDIHELDIDSLLNTALNNNDYRLATRYYYLKLLKYLSDLNHIDYQIEKTNSDYLLEIKKDEIIPDFSYLSYIYAHIWYGKFAIDAIGFKNVESKYQSFFKKLKDD
ncbi:hypothetical protein [Polaribacter sp. MED152]|uniref:hypothetical protein n=1 Tax=Polaribacter sp. MED152 TaxID=313598 RepID=UPI000068CC0D|nr:hypothetical protein [Polaribacter sp. MED152]EAQ41480.1 hypothetical protein MED152_02160 [Polaribacter sp. MED152]